RRHGRYPPADFHSSPVNGTSVSLKVEAGTFSDLSTVDGVSLTFTYPFDLAVVDETGTTVDYLVDGHELNTSLDTCDAGVGQACINTDD
ncbi:unnamed protein product, partial [Ectocarpus sp. 4 AP-2014]